MTTDNKINRRDLMRTAGAASAAGVLGSDALVQSQPAPPPGYADHPPFADNWAKPLSDIVAIKFDQADPDGPPCWILELAGGASRIRRGRVSKYASAKAEACGARMTLTRAWCVPRDAMLNDRRG